MKQLTPDVLHINQPAPDRCFHAIVAGRLASVRLVMSTCHLPGAVFRRSFLGMAAGKCLYDYAVNNVVFHCLDKIIVVSESGIEDLNKNYRVPSGKSVCVHNGVDCEKYCRVAPSASNSVRASLNIPEDVLLLASVGRLHEQKNYASLLKAFGCAHKRHPGLNLVIVGEGELRRELEQLAADLGLERVTHLVGQRNNIPEILAACDIYINSSRYEGLPFSILEAMASGLPVIASAIDGNREVIQHDHGILVYPGDQDKMVEAIMSLVEDERKRKRLGNSGREFVARFFSLAGMMSKTEQVYLDAASN
jgi:glycosyltransferase involved in cell wall biosynthesis